MTEGDAGALVLFKAGPQILVTFSLSHSIIHRAGGNLTSGHVIRLMLRFWKQEGNLLGHARGRVVMLALLYLCQCQKGWRTPRTPFTVM